MTGAQAAINATIASLAYQGNLDFVGGDTLTVTSTDSASSTDSDTVAIAVTPVNDAPAGTDATVTTNEDTAYAFTVANFGFTDVDGGDALSAVRIDTLTLPVGATLQLSGVNVNANDVILVADIAAGNLVFTPALNQNGAGYASFTFSARDTGGPAFDPAPNTMIVNVTAVNDAPAGTNATVTTNEDIAYAFTVADFGFTDVDGGDTLSAVRIDTLALPVGATLAALRRERQPQRRDPRRRHHRRQPGLHPGRQRQRRRATRVSPSRCATPAARPSMRRRTP